MDHWVVALPVKATFALTLRAADFVATAGRVAPQPVEELAVRLTGRPITFDLNLDMTGLRVWHVWTGTAISNSLRIADCPH